MKPIVELERRFLLNENIDWFSKYRNFSKIHKEESIVQGYLFHNEEEQLRIRKTNNIWYVLTHKKIVNPVHRIETNLEIPIIIGETLLKTALKTVYKNRIYLNKKQCIDHFYLQNIYILEVEFDEGEELLIDESILLEDPLVKEITLDKTYTNYNLAF
jgi:CYTH domain-containing protein